MIWQKYLMPDEEYACPVFRSKATGTRTMIIKGLSYMALYGEVVENELINQYLYDISDAVGIKRNHECSIKAYTRRPFALRD